MQDKSAGPRSRSSGNDAAELAEALRAQVQGEVRFDGGSRALYATDGSNYRQVPIGVVLPCDGDDVLAAISVCRQFGAPLLCRGAGTSLAGQCCNVAVVLDFSRHMNRILEIDPAAHIARVQPGVVLDQLRNSAEKYHLTFGPDPASHNRCTIGGMIGNNSCGVHSVMAGKTDENIEELEIVTYDGARLHVGQNRLESWGDSAGSASAPAPGAIRRRSSRPSGGPEVSGRSLDVARAPSPAKRANEILDTLHRIAHQYGPLIRQKFPNIPRRVSGYNLNHLLPENGFHIARSLVGSEGTCVTVLEATCRLVESPPQRVLLVLAFPDIYECADRVPEILAYKPIGLEGFDDILVACTRAKNLNPGGLALLPDGGGWLLAEFGGQTLSQAESKALSLMQSLDRGPNPPKAALYSGVQAKRVWEIRESSLGATSYVPGQPMAWEGWEDAAVAPEKVGGYLRDLRKLVNAFGYTGSFYGHFGHGCVHNRLSFDLRSKEGVGKFRRFIEEAADLVVSYGGSLSGEHGDGQARAELLPKMFGPELVEAFRKFKSAWDPDGKMNPGKVVDAYKIDENLRLGPDYAPWEPKTHFQFPDDNGGLAGATLRCVGVGKCRRGEGGVMCPSYRVTREEEHSTRGRAHLLWEMTQTPARKDAIIRDGWRSQEVKRSLDLCLACKGCKSDCPTRVDVASYKAEFLSHHYEGRIRPMSAYAFGNIDVWARIASNAPGLANLTTQLPFFREIAKFVAGIPRQRKIPPFAAQTFKQWLGSRRGGRIHPGSPPGAVFAGWGGRPPSQASRAGDSPRTGESEAPAPLVAGVGRGGGCSPDSDVPEVLLWADTFNNYFLPQTARAALEVLETAGFRVRVPQANLCCGRPLYDFGMLDRAERLLLEILDTLEPEIEAGIPIVGLEPSCVAVFRDELTNLFPGDARAQALSRQTFLLSEFLEQKLTPGAELPQLNRRALLHGHCHHKSIMKMTAEEALLKRLGVEFHSPAPGCCGMAGSFGFERDKYEISEAIGELELLPAVRSAPADWLIIADGFSCREQISQGTGRHALHLAEVLEIALNGTAPDDPYPESASVRQRRADVRASMQRAGVRAGALAAAGLLLGALAYKRL
jgi:FAD/FMN-containing dehydrogenase/Fe-S oxidoreductase